MLNIGKQRFSAEKVRFLVQLVPLRLGTRKTLSHPKREVRTKIMDSKVLQFTVVRDMFGSQEGKR